MDLTTAARPLHFAGKTNRAVLLIHGFTSTPASVAGWAQGLHQALGDTVAVPLLPGHGTKWQDLNRVSWHDWEATVLKAFDELAQTHSQVVVGGLSLGGALALLVVLKRPRAAALLLVNHLLWLGNPALPLAPLIKRVVASMPAIAGDIAQPGVVEPAYDRVPTGGVDQFRRLMGVVRRQLRQVTLPTLMFKSRQDHVIPLHSTTKTWDRLGSERKELIWLERSYHVATMDYDLELIVERSAAFVRDVLG